MVSFDEKGHIYPYEVIEMTLSEVEDVFVKNMDELDHRKKLFDNYLRFMEDFRSEIGFSFFQWMNGSFTTTKPFPGDIDFVNFINYDQFVRKLNTLNHFRKIGKTDYNLDAHFATTSKWNHRFYQRAIGDELYWKNIFGSTRPDDHDVNHPKGIIKIKF